MPLPGERTPVFTANASPLRAAERRDERKLSACAELRNDCFQDFRATFHRTV